MKVLLALVGLAAAALTAAHYYAPGQATVLVSVPAPGDTPADDLDLNEPDHD